ncbi:MAG: NAD(P)H-quinone oxidoreductase [Deltaproteobacteria bacterium]|nr:NAD(P)H-quinone oxidoreductase [Deltaproteobacteria bacterium]
MITARVIRISEPGGVEVLRLDQSEIAEPGGSEVLVAVRAAGLNRADVLQRRGLYPAPPGYPQDIPGLEFAGEVVRVGPRARCYQPGDRVMGITAGGAMSTHLLARERELIPIPMRLSFAEAAAIPEVFLTAYDALLIQGGLRAGQAVLIHSIGSGVGSAALQLGLLAGAQVIGTSRSELKLETCRGLGLKHAVLVKDAAFARQVREQTEGRMAQLILDTVGGAYLGENIEALAPGGQIIVIGLLGGARGDLSLNSLLAKRASIHGSVLRSRSLEEKAALAQGFIRELLPRFESGELRPVIDRVMPMDSIQQAQRRMEQNLNFGKIVLQW